MVVYYTGTGNSRYVAQRFAAALGDDLITANESIKNDTPAALHSDRRLADPAHFCGLSAPRQLHRQPGGLLCHDLRQ